MHEIELQGAYRVFGVAAKGAVDSCLQIPQRTQIALQGTGHGRVGAHRARQAETRPLVRKL